MQVTGWRYAAVTAALTLAGATAGWWTAAALSAPEPAVQPTFAETYADPFAYCAAVRTADTPGERYAGPPLPPTVAEALHNQGLSAESAVWRCMGGKLYACTAGTTQPCAHADQRTNPPARLQRWCGGQPNAPAVPVTVAGQRTLYQWRCQGAQPVVLQQVATADDRGFIAEFWHELPPP
jgi:hypothetical protein